MNYNIIQTVLLFSILYFTLVKVSGFYGLDTSTYGIYVTFFIFLVACTYAFPTNYTDLMLV
jgi:hypothetical protein